MSLLLIALFWFGSRNSTDPVWLETGALLRQRYTLIADCPDSLQQLYCNFNKQAFRPGDSTALRLVSIPYLSNIEWTSFRDFCQAAYRQRFMVISGVTGVGATKQAKRMARLIAGRESNLLEIDCAPQFDLELHKRFIGHEENGLFVTGELLRFWERCRQYPEQNFVAVANNFDKINPETFFGPELWETLSSPRDPAVFGTMSVSIPPNFFFFSVTHLGPGSLVELNEEHFKRLGRQYIIHPNLCETVETLRRQAQTYARAASLNPTEASRLSALQDSNQMHRYLFYVVKMNRLLSQRYAEGYQLGQGSNIKSLYRAEDLNELKSTFLNHINSLQPAQQLTGADFEPLDYTARSGGLEPGSSFLARQVQYLRDTGYFVEITMVAMTALLTALAGWWVFRRREQLIRRYGDRAQQVYNGFEKQQVSAEIAARRLEEIKIEVDNLVMRRQLNYTEGLYFLAFIEDKVKRIEFARNVSENFLELFNAFMEDNVLTESEYHKLRQFLQSIRHKIPAEVYDRFKEKVEKAYAAQ